MSEDPSPLNRKTHQLREKLSHRSPQDLARHTGTTYLEPGPDKGQFQFSYWGKEIILPRADFVARERETRDPLGLLDQAMIAYYFHDSRRSTPGQGWISFSELPDGQFYNAAFQGYTSRKIQSAFQNQYAAYDRSARDIGGQKVDFASRAFRLQILPRAAALIACWEGDKELPPSYRILFQESIIHHLPTDACAILGSMITSKLIASRDQMVPSKDDITRTKQGQKK